MKATGIVRNVDSLGRIVLPKELRRTMLLRDGDPVEIFTGDNGELILKKHSLLSGISEHIPRFAKTIQSVLGYPVCICDISKILAVTGVDMHSLNGQEIHKRLRDVLDKRECYLDDSSSGRPECVPLTKEGIEYPKATSQLIMPIYSDGYPIGAIVMLCCDRSSTFGNVEIKCLELISSIISELLYFER